MKKAIFAFTFAMITMLFIPVYAQYNISVTIDGHNVTFSDQTPILVEGRVLAPVRSVFVELGFEPDWDEDTRQVTLTRPNIEIIITIDSAEFTTNGVAHTLDVPAQLVAGRTMVPLRSILESVGYKLDWEGNTNTVQIATVNAEPSAIIGTWSWVFMEFTLEYYIFEADGTGYMLFDNEQMIAINWSTKDGVLSICITPDLCGSICFVPSDWYYVVDGDMLELTSTQYPDMTFVYVIMR